MRDLFRILVCADISSVSGYATCRYSQSALEFCFISPDTLQALTRLYNQPTISGPDGRLTGALYKNPIDCLWKTFKAEGVYGWYKGTTHLSLTQPML